MSTVPTTATDLRYVQQGEGPDVVLIAGLTDIAEAWQAQLDGLSDRYRLTAFDNRGAGRSPLPEGELTVASMADDTADLMRALGIERAHIAGFSGGGAVAQEVALRHPQVVRSLVLSGTFPRLGSYQRRMLDGLSWMAERAPSEHAFLEAFFPWIYSPAFHESGDVDRIIDETLAYPYPQSPEGFEAQVAAFSAHDTVARLHLIDAPTLVISGGIDTSIPVELSQVLADRIPGAEHVVVPGYAHQPFQEDPEGYDAIVDSFWARVGTAAG